MPDARNREIRLRRRPEGLPQPGDFELVEPPIPEPGPGAVLVRNLFLSVDPYMRGRMRDRKSYVPPFQLGETLQGGAVGEVAASNHPRFAPGDPVLSWSGWREWFVSDGKDLEKIAPGIAPLEAYLGVLGMPGLTAYVGLTRIARVKKDEGLFVSAAAGAVGSTACQIARNLGCKVVGSAGTDAKCAYLTGELGIAGAINYRKADLAAALADAFPYGIDAYFDNVGGTHLAAALDNMKEHGRIAACGMIEQYNSAPASVPNLSWITGKRLTVQGFLVFDHYDLFPEFRRQMTEWIAAGKMRTGDETVVEGIERAPEAFIGLFRGENTGKMLVKL